MSIEPTRPGSGCVSFTTAINIRNVESARRDLVAALDGFSYVELEVLDSEDSDLTLVQLVEAARESARQRGKAFRLAKPAVNALREMLERGGFLSATESREFWLQGDHP